jgi:hypothetical protein
MYINGVRISNKANSNADGNGLTQSYNSVENGGYLISMGIESNLIIILNNWRTIGDRVELPKNS